MFQREHSEDVVVGVHWDLQQLYQLSSNRDAVVNNGDLGASK